MCLKIIYIPPRTLKFYLKNKDKLSVGNLEQQLSDVVPHMTQMKENFTYIVRAYSGLHISPAITLPLSPNHERKPECK